MRDERKSTEETADWVITDGARLGAVNLTERVVDAARAAGAAGVGIAPARPFQKALATLESHLRSGMSGPLGFTYSDPVRSTDVRLSAPWAKSIVTCGVSYVADAPGPAETGPVIARFATADNYQPVTMATDAVTSVLVEMGARAKTFIDDSHLVDRAAAVAAGVGWIGRSTMVLAPGHGPWMLLGSVVTDADLTHSSPMRRDCGTCTACVPACPTGAITPVGLDARRCLSTWLQTPGSIPHWVRPVLGRRVYGCDDCLTSCPPGHPSLRKTYSATVRHSFAELLELSDETLVDRFRWWFVPRRDGRFMRRNLLVAAGNSGDLELSGVLTDHLAHRSSLIRGHAAWALARLGHEHSGVIRQALEDETTPEGRDEMILALAQLERPGLYRTLLDLDHRVTTDESLHGLALLGVSPSGAVSDPRPLILDDTPPAATTESLAGLIRVNDRRRVLETMRRRAQDLLESA